MRMNKFKVSGAALLMIFTTTLPAYAEKILNGKYTNSPLCGYDCCIIVEVKNSLYRSQDACANQENGLSPWKSTNELQSVRKGVVRSPFKRVPQLCLESLITKTRSNQTRTGYLDSLHSTCTAKGWVYNTKAAL
jgi:hypothetical protein